MSGSRLLKSRPTPCCGRVTNTIFMKLRYLIDKTVKYLLVLLLAGIVANVLLQVISRYIFDSPLGFTDELASFMLIWLGLLGAAYTTGTKQHLAIEIIHQYLNAEKHKYLQLFINTAISAFAISVLVAGGGWLVYTSFLFGQTSAVLKMPIGYVYLIAPLAGLLIIYYCADDIRHEFKGRADYQPEPEEPGL